MWVPSEVLGKQEVTIRTAFESDGVPFWVRVFFHCPKLLGHFCSEEAHRVRKLPGKVKSFYEFLSKKAEMSVHLIVVVLWKCWQVVKPPFAFPLVNAFCGKVLDCLIAGIS